MAHTHRASTPGPLHLLFLCSVSTSVTSSSQASVKCNLLQKTFLISQRLPASGSLLFLSKCLGWGPGPSPVTQNLDMLPGLRWIWAVSRGGRRCLAVPGTDASAQVLPWEATVSIRPGFRGTGGKAQRPPTQTHLTSLTQPLTPGCPALSVKLRLNLGHRLTHVTGPSSAASQPTSSNLRSPALCS